jgi:hypothetical protein
VIESLRGQALRRPDPRLNSFIEELTSYVPQDALRPDHLGFAVPLRLRSEGGRELQLLTTLTSFATATDITLAELHLEAFLPADASTADYLRARRG